MPVSAQTPINSYTANGVTTVFAYDFKALTSADILVTVDGVTKTLTTDYTLSGVGSDVGGNVTFLVAPVNTATVVIQRDIAYDRTVDYQENGDFAAATIDNDLDRIVMQLQQLAARTFQATTAFIWNALNRRISNVADPVNAQDAVTKSYADQNYGAVTATINDNSVTAPKLANDSVTTPKLANDSVTFAKIQNIATSRILGRSTALSGDVEELTIGAGLSLVSGQLSSPGVQILPISASVAANALTISASALSLDFRSTTLGSGTVTTVSGTPSNLVISSGSTLGTVNATQSDIVVLAINNSGTIELAAVNLAGGTQLDETNLISTTAEGGAGAADSSNVVYSTTARTNVAYRVLGIVRSTQTTAGTWATAPSLIQGSGGQAFAAMQSLGYGQTWQSVTRASATTYYNTTGKPILIQYNIGPSSSTTFLINGFDPTGGSGVATPAGTRISLVFVIPSGQSYSYTGGTVTATELR